jgi:hypothetical protein
MSIDPMTATTSDMSRPWTITGRALRLMNEGGRTRNRQGLFVPSLTR